MTNLSSESSSPWSRGTISKLENRFPKLTFQNRFCGPTVYLDGIGQKDVDSPIMRGIDRYGRVFITIRYRCLDEAFLFDGKRYPLDLNRINCLTIFQRYTNASTWCKAGRDSSTSLAPLLYGSSTYLDDETLTLLVDNIFKLMESKPCLYYDYLDKLEQIPSVKREMRLELVSDEN